MVRAPDLKSSGPGFKFRSGPDYLALFHGRPKFKSSATLVNNQLACLLSVGIFNRVMLKVSVSSVLMLVLLAPCYNHLQRVNKKHENIYFHEYIYLLFIQNIYPLLIGLNSPANSG